MVAATQVLLSPRYIQCNVFNYLFQFGFSFSFPRISCYFYVIFPFREGAKIKDLEEWTLRMPVPHVSAVWGRKRDGFVQGPEVEALCMSLPHFMGDKSEWPKALCRRFADRPPLLTQFLLAFSFFFFRTQAVSQGLPAQELKTDPDF